LFWVYQIRQYFNERKNKLSTSILVATDLGNLVAIGFLLFL